jgi:predicted transcriptional regulator
MELSLRSENRVKIFRTISLRPGIHLHELQRVLGVSLGSIRYNVEELTRSGRILRDTSTGYSRLYPIGLTDRDRVVYSLIENKTTRIILSELIMEGSATNKKLTEKTGFAKSTVSEHVHKLLQASIAKLMLSDKGEFRVQVDNPDYIRSLLSISEDSLPRKDLIENYTDLWDF